MLSEQAMERGVSKPAVGVLMMTRETGDDSRNTGRHRVIDIQ